MTRGFTPWIAVGGLVVVALGAAILSVATAPREVYYSVPSGSRESAQTLAEAAKATTEAPSFTMNVNDGGSLIYQAPDRISQDSEFLPQITIGRTIYVLAESPGDTWIVEPVDRVHSVPYLAFTYLDLLTSLKGVSRHGDEYSGLLVAPANRFAPRGTPLYVSAIVESGRISAEKLSFPALGGFPKGTDTITYSKFGTSPPVTIPPSDHVVRALKCLGSYWPPDVGTPCHHPSTP
ncbi:MAG TPA: hypothetical protein VEJ87_16740 [Acidimicrobiales bacterium]|nr:hypothetical protein [Acidimicrobiales bacterium]